MTLAWLILVTGHPASGKTTLADALARDLNWIVFHRDTFKEALFDTLGAGSLDQSKAYGRASWDLLHEAARAVLARDVPLILEANYSRAPGRDEVLGLARDYSCSILELVLKAPPAVLTTRYQRRLREGTRHPGHHDEERLLDHAETVMDPYQPLEVGTASFTIDTSQPTSAFYPALLAQIVSVVQEEIPPAGTLRYKEKR